MSAAAVRTEKELAQRRRNAKAIGRSRRQEPKCKRGHRNWHIRKDGRRVCRTCSNDRRWYSRRGLNYV